MTTLRKNEIFNLLYKDMAEYVTSPSFKDDFSEGQFELDCERGYVDEGVTYAENFKMIMMDCPMMTIGNSIRLSESEIEDKNEFKEAENVLSLVLDTIIKVFELDKVNLAMPRM